MIKKILIVDDSASGRFFIKSCLPKDGGYEIFEADNGLTGLEAFKTHRPDVTFMDLTMPVMDGFQSIEEIKKVDKDAVVIVLTADIQKRTEEKVKVLGAFKMLKKPPSKNHVQEALSAVLEAREKKE